MSLFKDIDNVILECINESVDMKNQSAKTSGPLKHLENIQKTNVNKVSFITLDEGSEDQFQDIKELEMAPDFVYMPSKLQMMTMIANAAFHNE